MLNVRSAAASVKSDKRVRGGKNFMVIAVWHGDAKFCVYRELKVNVTKAKFEWEESCGIDSLLWYSFIYPDRNGRVTVSCKSFSYPAHYQSYTFQTQNSPRSSKNHAAL